MLLLGLCTCAPEMWPSHEANVKELFSRASFDLNCPREELRTVQIDARTRGMSGCGHRAAYVKTCSDGDCTWVLNGDSTPSGRAKAAADEKDDHQ